MENRIGINQHVSLQTLDMAMRAALDERLTEAYARDIALGECDTLGKAQKVGSLILRLTLRNPLFSYIKQHREEYLTAIRFQGDRALVFTALVNAAYPFAYSLTTVMGRYFHAGDNVSSGLVLNRLSRVYASNHSLSKGIYSVLPMLLEAGIIRRVTRGLYARREVNTLTDFSLELYRRSFFVNNPLLDNESVDFDTHPYFEFCRPL